MMIANLFREAWRVRRKCISVVHLIGLLLSISSPTLAHLAVRETTAARIKSSLDCSEVRYIALLGAVDRQEDHRRKLEALLLAGHTRAACISSAPEERASRTDDAANNLDAAADQAMLIADKAYACRLHQEALVIENEQLPHLNQDGQRIVRSRRDDTLRGVRMTCRH